MPRSISYSVVGSTQEVAIRLAKEGAPHGTSVVAESQLLGRGREGRPWTSPKGGLYTSVVLRPEAPVFPLLSLATGLELQKALAPYVPKGKLTIRWPNDLLLGPLDADGGTRKVGGVLTDVISRPGVSTFAVVGVGINVDGRRTDFPPELQPNVAFLREYRDDPITPTSLSDPVHRAVLQASERLSLPEGRHGLPQALTPYLWGIGRHVAMEGTTGTFAGVGPEGEALVHVGGNSGAVRSFLAGEIRLEGP